MKIINTIEAPEAIGPYSQAVASGGFLFLSGQIALNPQTMTLVNGDAAIQTKRVLLNIEAILRAAGIDKRYVLKSTVFLKKMTDFAMVNKIYEDFFEGHRPARSTVEVANLPKGALVEIECVAKMKD
ncbi:MAG: endoribonuclease L-PSP, TdcF protein [Candidatus Peregrinibacteria bacterium GW2011_GWF2_39_17]|nr:MAG: endoribonuclease L-PSP, TdcF protein [Candidatus Peregrinibacteria bacterium GW2011_GWF2_39_17]HCW32322.1 reactive intermediate/imine deaminase [Candidatus Peregrinibacteria bacterium]